MAGKLKAVGKWTADRAKGFWGHLPGTDANKRRIADFQAKALAPAVAAGVKEAIASGQGGQQQGGKEEDKEMRPGGDTETSGGDLAKLNAWLEEAVRKPSTGERDPATNKLIDPGMVIYQVLSSEEVLKAFATGKRTIVHEGAVLTVSLLSPLEEADDVAKEEMAKAREALASALARKDPITITSRELDIIYSALVGRATFPDSKVEVWQDWSGPLPKPPKALLDFLEVRVKNEEIVKVTDRGGFIGNVMRDLTTRSTFDNAAEGQKGLYGIERPIMDPVIARDYLRGKVSHIGSFLKLFDTLASEVMAAPPDRLVSPDPAKYPPYFIYSVPGLGLKPEAAAALRTEFSDGLRAELQDATSKDSFYVVLERLKHESQALPSGTQMLLVRLKAEIEARVKMLDAMPDDVKIQAARQTRQEHAMVIDSVFHSLESDGSVKPAIKAELDALLGNVKSLCQSESVNSQKLALGMIGEFESRMKYPLREVAKKILGIMEWQHDRAARGEIAPYERLIALNVFQGRFNQVPSVEVKKTRLWTIKWLKRLGHGSVWLFKLLPYLHIEYLVKPAIRRMREYPEWREFRRQYVGMRKDAQLAAKQMLDGELVKLNEAVMQVLSAKGSLESAAAGVEDAEKAGEDISAAQEKLGQALAAFEIRDYGKSAELASEAYALVSGDPLPSPAISAPDVAAVADILGSRESARMLVGNFITRRYARWRRQRALVKDVLAIPKNKRDLDEAYAGLLKHRRRFLYGTLIAEATLIGTLWAGVAGFGAAFDKPELLIPPKLHMPFHGEVFSGWKRSVFNLKNWHYDLKGGRVMSPKEMSDAIAQLPRVPVLPQDLKDPKKLDSHGLWVMYGVNDYYHGKAMADAAWRASEEGKEAKKKADAVVQWLQEDNLEPSRWQHGQTIPSVLAYLEELRFGAKTVSIRETSVKGKPTVLLERENVPEALRDSTFVLRKDGGAVDAFIGEIMARRKQLYLSKPDALPTSLAGLEALTQELYDKSQNGPVWTRAEARYRDSCGVAKREHVSFLMVNPVLNGLMHGYANLGTNPLYMAKRENADKIVAIAVGKAKVALGAEDISRMQVEKGENLATLLKAFDTDAYLEAAKKEYDALKDNDPKKDPKRAEFFSWVGSYLDVPKDTRDIRTLLGNADKAEKARLLHGAVYEQVEKEALGKNLLRKEEQKFIKTQARNRVADAKRKYGFVSGRADDAAAFVLGEKNADVRAFLDKLSQPRPDYVLRQERVERFVLDVLMPHKNGGGKVWDFDPTTTPFTDPTPAIPPGVRSEWAKRMGYIIDWGTKNSEDTERMSKEEKQKMLEELRQKESSANERLKQLKTEREKKVKEIADKKGELASVDTKFKEWRLFHLFTSAETLGKQQAILLSQIKDLETELAASDKEVAKLRSEAENAEKARRATEAPSTQPSSQPSSQPASGPSAAASAGFWSGSKSAVKAVDDVLPGLLKKKNVQAALKLKKITDAKKYCLDYLQKIARVEEPWMENHKKMMGMKFVVKDGVTTIELTSRKGLRVALYVKLTE